MSQPPPMRALAPLPREIQLAVRAPRVPRGDWLIFAVVALVALALTVALAVAGMRFGHLAVLGLLVVAVVIVLIVWRPITGYYVVALCAVLIESDPLPYNILTNQLDVFSWPPQLAGLPERPIGFLLLFIFLVLIVQRLATRQVALRGGRLIWPFLGLLACVAMGVLNGLRTGGQFKEIVLEIRPFVYLFECYLLAYNVVTEKKHVRNLLWILIIGSGIKALQGVYIIFVYNGGHLSGQNQIMAHEQSYFWVLVLLLIVLFALHSHDRPQLIAALVILPVLVPSLIANNRRADYAALVVGVGVAWVLIIAVDRKRRKGLLAGLIVCSALGLGYVVAFSHASGAIGEPARGLMSIIHPGSTDQRDALSNLYRTNENYDLNVTERQDRLLGYGFGKPFLQPAPLPNIAGLDPVYTLVPHNNILWIWMALGPLGYFAFWYLFGSIIITGCHIARQLRDPYLRLVAIFVVAAIIMEIMLAYADYQLYFYRNAILVGLLIGVMLKLPALETTGEVALAPVPAGESHPRERARHLA